jgi:SAM-dependent methyltransferase/uncharacterized protein YbaR (Trm112 family)
LQLARIEKETDGHILEGVLVCSNTNCQREFPILDGIPILIVNLRQYLADNILAIQGRRDLSHFTETLLGDGCGPNSLFETTRQHLSSYAWDHYGDLDPKEKIETGDPTPGSILATLKAAQQLANPWLPGPILDIGCSVGRSTFALAEQSNEIVLGMDLNYPMLRLASEILRNGSVRYPRRRVGLVYERREFPVRFKNTQQVDFWACDATALPFPAGTFSLATSLNVLDCLQAPREFLVSLANVMRTGGKTVIACPYDWSPGATAVEAWLGGHSQRSPMEGSCEAVLRTLLTPGAHAASINTLKLTGERDPLPWHVRLHDRSTMTYKLHMVAAERCPAN